VAYPTAWIDPKVDFTRSSELRFLVHRKPVKEDSSVNRTVLSENCSCTIFLIAESWGGDVDKRA